MSDTPTSICPPGYKHVESFSTNDSDYESGEEVSYITLDLSDVEPQLVPSASTYHLIGLDTPTPYLQLHGTIMKGRHNLLLGTELIFTDTNKRSLTHIANTDQRISFQEITLLPKQNQKAPAPSQSQPSTSTTRPTITTSHFHPSTKNLPTSIDNLTGLVSQPAQPRAPRTKQKTKPRPAKKKVEERLPPPSSPMDLDLHPGGIGDDDLEDIYE